MLHWYLLQVADARIRDKLPGLGKIVVVKGAFSCALKFGWGGLNRAGGIDYGEGERRLVRMIGVREGEGVEVVFRGVYPGSDMDC